MDCIVKNGSLLPDDQTLNGTETSRDILEYWPLPLITCLILAGIFGNCLVCLAISTNKELQNMTNQFLMSLAVADLLVSMVVMPFGAMVIFRGGTWPLSEEWCVFYQTCDVLGCSVSILHLMFISIGRYRGISRPLAQRQESERAVLGRIVLTWGLGLILASPIPVLSFIDIEHVMVASDRCELENRHFRLLGSLFSFYIPMVIMVTTYVLTVHQLSKKKTQSLVGSRHVVTRNAANSYNLPISNNESVHRCCRTVSSRSTQTPQSITREIMFTTRGGYRYPRNGYELPRHPKNGDGGPSEEVKELVNLNEITNTPNPGFESTSTKRRLVSQASRFYLGGKLSTSTNPLVSVTLSEEKASRVLGIVFCSFIVCWTPFFLLNLVTSVCERCSPPPWLGDIALWSGWVSSTINPLIYTVFNVKFRRCFVRILKCRFRLQPSYPTASSLHF